MKKSSASALPCLLLLMITAALYGRAASFDFVRWDDPDLVSENPLLRSPSIEHLKDFWTKKQFGLYTPLAYTAWAGVAMFAADEQKMLDPHLFHAWNILLHLVSTGLVYSILKKLTQKPWAAFFGALLFATHPMQVEAVAWVSGMNNLLAGALGLGAIWLYLKFRESRGWNWYWLGTGAFALALLSKPTAVVVPLIVLFLDWLDWPPLPPGEGTGRGRRVFFGPIALWLFFAGVEILITHFVQPAGSIARVSLWHRPIVALDALGFYLAKIFIPLHLSVDYGRTPQRLLESKQMFLTIAVAIVVAIAAIFSRRRAPALFCSFLIFIASLLPVLGLTPFDFQKYSTVADRYAYLAMLGPALAMAWLASRASLRFLAPLICGALVGLSALQLSVWRDSQALVQHTLALDAGSAIGNTIESGELAHAGHPDLAIPFYKRALARVPYDAALHLNLANALLATHQLDPARDEYLQAIALLATDLKPRALNNLGLVYLQTGQPELARAQFERALEIDPNFAEAKMNLARHFP